MPALKQHAIGRRLKDMGRTLTWLAEEINYTTPSLSQILKGSHYIRLETALAICDALGVDNPRELFDDHGHVRP